MDSVAYEGTESLYLILNFVDLFSMLLHHNRQLIENSLQLIQIPLHLHRPFMSLLNLRHRI